MTTTICALCECPIPEGEVRQGSDRCRYCHAGERLIAIYEDEYHERVMSNYASHFADEDEGE
jgi:hypothetical protein